MRGLDEKEFTALEELTPWTCGPECQTRPCDIPDDHWPAHQRMLCRGLVWMAECSWDEGTLHIWRTALGELVLQIQKRIMEWSV
jgi:hypothetical protein